MRPVSPTCAAGAARRPRRAARPPRRGTRRATTSRRRTARTRAASPPPPPPPASAGARARHRSVSGPAVSRAAATASPFQHMDSPPPATSAATSSQTAEPASAAAAATATVVATAIARISATRLPPRRSDSRPDSNRPAAPTTLMAASTRPACVALRSRCDSRKITTKPVSATCVQISSPLPSDSRQIRRSLSGWRSDVRGGLAVRRARGPRTSQPAARTAATSENAGEHEQRGAGAPMVDDRRDAEGGHEPADRDRRSGGCPARSRASRAGTSW